MIGRTVSHYRILSSLGSGGMGVVYLAEDSRLGRQVALKFLPASFSQETKALERFRVEARAASSLSHPAICAIYDIGQDGDTPFIVMEALKGETLRERIAKGPLKVADVLDIGIQLADALEAAHDAGHHPSRHQAGEHFSQRSKSREGSRLRAGEAHSVTVATLEQRGHGRRSIERRTTRSHNPAQRSEPCRTCRPSKRVES